MRRILTVYLETVADLREPTWADLLEAIRMGHIDKAAVLDSLVPNLQDITDARAILEGTATVATRPTAYRPGTGGGFVGEIIDELTGRTKV